MDTIACAYPEAPLREGESNAWRVRGRDNAACIAKFHPEGDRTALNELVCACLARHFGLPSLKPFLVLLETWHAEQINRQRATKNLPPIDAGPHFGVKYARSLLAAESFARTMGRAVSAGDIGNLDRVPDILGFGTLVQNNDRHCSNVGVVPSAAGRRYSYRVFDFGLAFFGRNWSAQQAAGRYRRLRPITHFRLVTSAIRGRGDFAGFIDALGASLEGGFDAVLDALPPEWGPGVRADVEGLRAAMAGLDGGSPLAAIVQGKNLQVTR